MKLLRPVILTLSFVIFLGAGLQLGLEWNSKSNATFTEDIVVTVSQDNSPTTPESQKSISPSTMTVSAIPTRQQHDAMILTVDDSDSTLPRLVSIWYFVIYPDDDSVIFLPVFPSINLQHQEWNYEIASNFRLTNDGLPEPSTLQKIHDLGILWHGDYVVFNQSAILEMAAFLGSQDPQYKISNIGALTTWEEDALSAVQSQAALLGELCDLTSLTIGANHIVSFTRALSPHLQTNIAPERISADWQHLASYSNQLDCQFPTLTP